MMLRITLIISILFTSFSGFSQEDDSYVFGDNASTSFGKSSQGGGFDWDRAVIGGGLGLAVSSNNTLIGFSPTFGYYITDNIMLGIGGEYTYQENFNTSFPYYANTYGGKIFAQYLFEDIPIIAHTELESVTIDVNYAGSDDFDETIGLINVYVGGGLNQRIGDYSNVYVLVLYNLNETPESNYIQTNPVIRVGIGIGL